MRSAPLAWLLFGMAMASALAKPVDLRCDFLENPLGIDDPQPRLGWQSDNTERNWRQTAYQILVATSAAGLRGGVRVQSGVNFGEFQNAQHRPRHGGQ